MSVAHYVAASAALHLAFAAVWNRSDVLNASVKVTLLFLGVWGAFIALTIWGAL